MKLVPRVTLTKTDAVPLAPLTEEAAAQAMWLFYLANKLQLIIDIKEYRAGILAQLTAGMAIKDVYAPYFKPAAPAKPTRRAA